MSKSNDCGCGERLRNPFCTHALWSEGWRPKVLAKREKTEVKIIKLLYKLNAINERAWPMKDGGIEKLADAISEAVPEEAAATKLRLVWYEKYAHRMLKGELLPYQREQLEKEWAKKDLGE